MRIFAMSALMIFTGLIVSSCSTPQESECFNGTHYTCHPQYGGDF